MQANELRIGNWVNDMVGTPLKVVAITDDDRIIYSADGGNYLFEIKYAKGIPLTSEILERCGFEKGCLVKELNNEWMIYYNNGMWLQVEKAEHPYICERKDLFHIKYLHQLQNLYYALTGSELEIR